MTPAEYICWISLFVISVLLFFHQKMILQHLKEATDFMVHCAIESIFRVEGLLKERKGTVLWIYEKDGVEYEIVEHKIEKGDNNG